VVIVHSAGKKLETGKKERYQHDVTMGMSRKKTKRNTLGTMVAALFCPIKNLRNCVDSTTVAPAHPIVPMISEQLMRLSVRFAIRGGADIGVTGEKGAA